MTSFLDKRKSANPNGWSRESSAGELKKSSKQNNRLSLFRKEKSDKSVPVPAAQQRTGVFGVPLAQVVASDQEILGQGQLIPFLLEECFIFLNRDIVYKSEGIFRQSGKATDIQDIKELYNKGSYVTFSQADLDPHVVTGLMKLFLRELADPLIPFSVYPSFVSYQRSSGAAGVQVESLRQLLEPLPPPNRVLLKLLFQLLKKASQYEKLSKMNASSLAIVIAPNIMRSTEQDMYSVMEESSLINKLCATFIENVNEIFDSDQIMANVSVEGLALNRLYNQPPYPPYSPNPLSLSSSSTSSTTSPLLGSLNPDEKKKTKKFLTSFFVKRPKPEELVRKNILPASTLL
eukprot:TRINITY_DN2002_c0_g1_i1.p1 TRINITY_DN2002_c0_g1~~TRINITY_DN2002_c0_g1_i1.p1  ORF type:complete len:347 (+),score=76.03 TRINITY_DN2002_c0_g1_i1:68-1108(+)